MNQAGRGGLNTAGSLNSTISTSSLVDLPNLPGVRRDVSQINPKLYRQFKASQSRGSLNDDVENGSFANEESSLFSFFDDSSRLELSRTLSPFPQNGSAYNDISGRYSLVSQKRDRIAKKLPLPYSSTDSLPSFVTNSSHVARFLGYFDEPATEVTDARSRKVEIIFYLEDNSIEIIEPKVENSGAVCGKFLKRHQIYKPVNRISCDTTKELYSLQDFYAGAELNIYNRIYTIIDCDNSTKLYMESSGWDFGFPLPVPKTVYDPRQRSSMSRPVTRTTTRAKRAGFFDYDRKVLRFFGVWDSRSMLFGDVIKVKLHYTLADDTIDIVAVPERNNGRDPQTTLLRKSVIMKRAQSIDSNSGRRTTTSGSNRPVTDSDHSPSPEKQEKDRPYHWKDLCIGEVVSVASLSVLLTDADEFTREFYNSHNMPLGPPITLPEPNYSKLSSSFAADDDSSTLLPSVQPKDGLKAQLFQGMILRYGAKIHNPKEADKSREFVIQVHLEDDTIQIKEPPIRNSGHKGGIFLARCKVDYHPTVSTDRDIGDLGSLGSVKEEKRSLEPADIYVGAVVSIHAHKFDILDCDNYTFKYMEANPNLWKHSNLALIQRKIADRKEVIQKIILTYPSLQSKNISVDQLEEIFSRSGLDLVKQEIYTVFRAVDVFRVGTLKLTKLLKYIIDLK